MSAPLYLPDMAIATCLGLGKAANALGLFAGERGFLVRQGDDPVPLGRIQADLPAMPTALHALACRNNQVIQALLDQLAEPLAALIATFGPHRIAVVLGTSTSGIAEGGKALAQHRATGAWPAGFAYSQQETGNAAQYVATRLGLTGPAYVTATACSSSAKAFASARRLIQAGFADAAIVGGADTLCAMTVAGFSSLEAVSATPCQPFAAERSGITIGEGGALFILSPEPSDIALTGIGERSDAHHLSAPDPSGRGAREAIELALADAGLDAGDIGYINLHGTATTLNDAMEAKAVHDVFGPHTPCSSTKALTGHTLGAAGAVEAAFLWLTLSPEWNPRRLLPPQAGCDGQDPDLPMIALTPIGATFAGDGPFRALSSSFAFGGSNCAVVLDSRR